MNRLTPPIDAASTDRPIRIREYERQRMGQDLHDSAGQLIVDLHLSVANLSQTTIDPQAVGLIEDIRQAVNQIDQEIRSLASLH